MITTKKLKAAQAAVTAVELLYRLKKPSAGVVVPAHQATKVFCQATVARGMVAAAEGLEVGVANLPQVNLVAEVSLAAGEGALVEAVAALQPTMNT